MPLSDISANPRDRLTDEMKEALEKDPRFDTHVHLFTSDDVPSGYIKMRLGTARSMLVFVELIARAVKRSGNEKLANFVATLRHGTGEWTLWMLINAYDHDLRWDPPTIFCVLLMDLERGFGNDSRHQLGMQIERMRRLQRAYPDRVLPFVAIDPQRGEDECKRIFEDAFTGEQPFFGVKIYPSLGYLPSDPVLMPIFEACAEKMIPVTTHCSSAAISARSNRIEVSGKHWSGREYAKDEVPLRSKTKKMHFFNHPENWRPVLDAFPGLHLNLAHFGSTEQWHLAAKGDKDAWPYKILKMMDDYEHLYSDFSYTFADEDGKAQKALKSWLHEPRVSQRVIFGTDYFMTERIGRLPSLVRQFEKVIGTPALDLMACTNARTFLGI